MTSFQKVVPMIGVARHRLQPSLEELFLPISTPPPQYRDDIYPGQIPEVINSSTPNTDAQILAQWVMLHYLIGLMGSGLDVHYRIRNTVDQISKWFEHLEEGVDDVKIKDPQLKKFMSDRTNDQINSLIKLAARLKLDDLIPIDLVYLVIAMYARTPYRMENITLFCPVIQVNDLMPVVLAPWTDVEVNIETSNILAPGDHRDCNRLWQLLLGIQTFSDKKVSLTRKMSILAHLAIPLNPKYNWTQAVGNQRHLYIQEMPVTNFCATMYRDSQMLGWPIWEWSDDGSVGRATTFETLRGQLDYAIRSTVGTGRQSIMGKKSIIMKFFCNLLQNSEAGEDPFYPALSARFLNKLEEATEASRVKSEDNIEESTSSSKGNIAFQKSSADHQTDLGDPDTKMLKEPGSPSIEPPKKQSSGEGDDVVPDFDDEDTTTSSSDGADASDDLGGDIEGNSSPDQENAFDNNIAPSDSAPDEKKVGKLIPLIGPDENLDDFLWKKSVLTFVSSLIENPNTDISPDAVDVLQKWCSQWLFLAKVQKTRELLAQLNITKLKEF